MGTLALDLASGKSASGALSPAQVTLFLTLVALMSGGLQFLYGSIGSGRLIKYIPFPVVSGYLSGVGLKIFLDQVPKLFGFSVSKEAGLWKGLSVGLTSPDLWQWQAIVVGTVTMMGMILGPKITKAVPAAILGLFGGIVTYLGLGLVDRTLLDLHNKLLIGPLATGGGHCGAE
jgi:SulP family sulfate permease